MDYCHKLSTLLYLSRKVNNVAAIYADIEDTIKKVPAFTELRYDCFDGFVCPNPLIKAIEIKSSENIIELLKKHYHKENNMYDFIHCCSLCPIHEETIECRGNIEVILNNKYYNKSEYIKNLAKLFNVTLIENRQKKHAYIIKHKILDNNS